MKPRRTLCKDTRVQSDLKSALVVRVQAFKSEEVKKEKISQNFTSFFPSPEERNSQADPFLNLLALSIWWS